MDWHSLFLKTGKAPLEKVRETLSSLGFMQTFKIFNVVGTNGKGSVASFLAQGFQSKGLKVGLFTSPHLVVPNERITINGQQITDEEFWQIYDVIKNESFNFFAFTYLVAMMHFFNNKCDIVVLEAGIGGTFDTTNTLKGDWGCITGVAFDHVEILGDTLEKILIDKIGIYHPKMKFYFPDSIEDNLQKTLCEKIPKAHKVQVDTNGSYQKRNAEFVQKMLQYNSIDFKEFKIPQGRSEVFKFKNQDVIVDVGHNYDGIKNTLEYLKEAKISFEQVVITMKKSKDSSKILSLFNLPKNDIYVYEKSNDFYSSQDFGANKIKNPRSFLQQINKPTLFIGSFHLAGEIIDERNKQNTI